MFLLHHVSSHPSADSWINVVEEYKGNKSKRGVDFTREKEVRIYMQEGPGSVVDDDGASHPQAGVRVWGGQDEPLRWALGDPAQGDLLAGLPASVPQLRPGQQPSGSPAGADTRQDHE